MGKENEEKTDAQKNLTQMLDLFEAQISVMDQQLESLNVFLHPTYSVALDKDGNPKMEITR